MANETKEIRKAACRLEGDGRKFYTILVYSENVAGVLSQVTAVFTRRQVNIESVNACASSVEGIHKITVTAWSSPDTIEKIARQIEKKIDVVKVDYYEDSELFIHEVGFCKISSSVLLDNPRVSSTIRRHGAHIMEVNPAYSIVLLTGSTTDLEGLYHDLSELGCMLQFTRSGRVAIPRSAEEPIADFITKGGISL